MSKPIIPAAALEQHTAILGKTGSGKTYTAKAVIVEPLLERGVHVGLVDPADAWWGLRSSRDGKGAGYPVLVLGGPHGDLPLPANGGEAVARLLIEQRVNLIACTKGLTVGERTRWAIAFFGTINRLNQRPLYLVVDEAHQFAPQGKVPDPDTGRMLHEVNTLASGGRGIGVRLTMITQRPQKLHKDTLTCADTLIALRVLAPHDRDAVKAWIDGCGDPTQGRQVLDSLAGLKRGEGWVWYPEGEHLLRAKFPQISTFDSSATPTAGQEIAAPKKAAEVNLDAIRSALADAVKEAEANDPKLLRAEIASLRKENAGLRAGHADVTLDPKAIDAAEARGYGRGQVAGFNDCLDRLLPQIARLDGVKLTIEGIEEEARKIKALPPVVSQVSYTRHTAPPAPRPQAAPRRAGAGPGEAMARAERQILIVLAQRHPKPASRAQLSILSGYSISSSSFANALGALRSRGYSNGYGDENRITEVGFKALGAYDPLPTGKDLVTWWLGRLQKAERAFLEYIAGRYPAPVSKEELAGETGYSITSSSFANALGKLRSLELITRDSDPRASSELFDG